MLAHHDTTFRDSLTLNGLWGFRADPESQGESERWGLGFHASHEIAVPGSWRDQLAEYGLMHYTGAAWLQREVWVPPHFAARRLVLRLGATGGPAKVWINGAIVAETDHGALPFDVEAPADLPTGAHARVVLRIAPDQADERAVAGVHGPVHLLAMPRKAIQDVSVRTFLDDADGFITASVRADGDHVRARLVGGAEPVEQDAAVEEGVAQIDFRLGICRMWTPRDPFLHQLDVTLIDDGAPVDAVTLPIGVREVALDQGALKVNAKPHYLRGLRRQDDAPVLGAALADAQQVKDLGALDWLNANAVFLTSLANGPSLMAMADRRGLLVIAQITGVTSIESQIALVHNHAALVAWAVTTGPDAASAPDREALIARLKSCDPTRPVVLVAAKPPRDTQADIIAVSPDEPGPEDFAAKAAAWRERLDAAVQRTGKPLLALEQAASAWPGHHAAYDQHFTEEHQAQRIEVHGPVSAEHAHCIGEVICDFADGPPRRTEGFAGRTGVFTRLRAPKRAAYAIKDRWARLRSSAKA